LKHILAFLIFVSTWVAATEEPDQRSNYDWPN